MNLVTAALKRRDGVVICPAACAGVSRCAGIWSHVPYGRARCFIGITATSAASPAGWWPRALAEVAAVFLLQLALPACREIASPFSTHWQNQYHPNSPCIASVGGVACPDHFDEEAGSRGAIMAPVVFAIEIVSLFFARAFRVSTT